MKRVEYLSMKMGLLSSTSVPLNGEVKKVSGIQVKVCPEVLNLKPTNSYDEESCDFRLQCKISKVLYIKTTNRLTVFHQHLDWWSCQTDYHSSVNTSGLERLVMKNTECKWQLTELSVNADDELPFGLIDLVVNARIGIVDVFCFFTFSNTASSLVICKINIYVLIQKSFTKFIQRPKQYNQILCFGLREDNGYLLMSWHILVTKF